MASEPDLTTELLRRIQTDQAQMRKDVLDIQQNYADIARLIQRLDHHISERRISDIKQDLETMFKMEILAQFANFETRQDERFATQLDNIRSLLVERLPKA